MDLQYEVVNTDAVNVMKPMMAVDQIDVQPRMIGGRECLTALARDVHEYLGLARRFTDWADSNFARARLKNGRDYEVYHADVKNPQGGRPSVDYVLTLDAAKHICMVSETERGFEAREHFIECERRAAAAPALPRPKNTLEVVRAQHAMLGHVMDEVIEFRAEQQRQAIVIAEQAQAQQRHEAQLQEVRAEVADILQYTQRVAALMASPVPKKPAGCEAMTTYQTFFGKRDKLPGWVTDRVLTQVEQFRVLPTAYVQNGVRHNPDHTVVTDNYGKPIDARGYLVYQHRICVAAIDDFLKGCVRISPCRAIHPAIPGKTFAVKYGSLKGDK